MIRQAVLQYIHEERAVDRLTELLAGRKTVMIHGEKALQAASPYLGKFPTLVFRGHCTDEQVGQLVDACETYEIIIALGGGSVIDTAKQVAVKRNCPLIVIPTIVSNCAPWTPLSVMYDERGQYLRFDTIPVVIEALLLDRRILAASPYDYFVAGLVDTLAKWYEARALSGTTADDPVVESALRMAEHCKELILRTPISPEQFKDYPSSIQYLVETVIPLAGSVGGFGDEATRGAIGHGIHNALSPFPSTHRMLHGSKVGYGLLIQELLLGQTESYAELQHYLVTNQQPTTSAQLGLTEAERQKIAERIGQEPLCQLIKTDLSPETVLSILMKNDQHVAYAR
ncbi:iron-containing alcohol dehydrogenase family protein [Exiguobacterium antarcticum]|uniref:iron-containing alcohol dehydrogenase family protein n=1 Tax=Exiguobacterium antarcticum TaxID=132920 RepID=UPI000285E8DE|nr:iron-containing alcohol dehydrogenase family protein [Exiguobacterium antarcticum]AFS69549.1 Iron-containing alcohol dehydrogenase [Exiguobacterium antarcticum B7]